MTRIAQPPDALSRLRRDAHEAAARAEELADVTLRIDDDPHPA